MNRAETIELLGACSANLHMTLHTIEEMIPSVTNEGLKERLYRSVDAYKVYDHEILDRLQRLGGRRKEPNPIVHGLSLLRANVQLAFNTSGTTVANVLTDRCNAGVKSITRSKNKYPAADHQAKVLADRIIYSERRLVDDLHNYL